MFQCIKSSLRAVASQKGFGKLNLILVCKIAVRSEREYCSFATFSIGGGTLVKEHVHEVCGTSSNRCGGRSLLLGADGGCEWSTLVGCPALGGRCCLDLGSQSGYK